MRVKPVWPEFYITMNDFITLHRFLGAALIYHAYSKTLPWPCPTYYLEQQSLQPQFVWYQLYSQPNSWPGAAVLPKLPQCLC